MELHDLQAFVAAAQELHFARAAERLRMPASSMSEIIRRLEGELGGPLFTRTTRRVELTAAGAELLGRAERILELTAEAGAAVRATTRGTRGRITVGVTPPAAPVLLPHLIERFSAHVPEAVVSVEQMWLPELTAALAEARIDVAITCGALPDATASITTATIGAEPLLVGLRAQHPLASRASVSLEQLAGRPLGIHPRQLFPAWSDIQHQILSRTGLTPPLVQLRDPDLTARAWVNQPEVEWIMLTGSLQTGHEHTVVRPVSPAQLVPFTISWSVDAQARALVSRFVRAGLNGPLPAGWLGPGTRFDHADRPVAGVTPARVVASGEPARGGVSASG